MNNNQECVCDDNLPDDSFKELRELERRMRKALEEGDQEEAEIIFFELELYAAKKKQDQERISKIENILKRMRFERDARKLAREGPSAAPEGRAGTSGTKGDRGVDAKKGRPVKKDCCGKAGRPAR